MSTQPNDLKKIVVICGPTGIGKTGIAIEAAQYFNTEIISADSMQIYRYMNIGTAKPTPDEQKRIPHHMIDIVDPDESFDAAMYAKIARERISELHALNKIPFVVGGTGFYIKSLIYGIFDGGSSDLTVRRQLKELSVQEGSAVVYQRLIQCDPEAAKKIHPNDTYRIVRALEIFETTGKPISEHRREHSFSRRHFDVLTIGINTERKELYNSINQRTMSMIEAGLVDEVKGLLDMGFSEELNSMQSIGYRHMIDFIFNRLCFDEAVRLMKRDTRRYAKRQLTWFLSDPEIIWEKPGNSIDCIIRRIKEFSPVGFKI